MPNKKENLPFTYQRGNVKFTGRTETDRRSARIDNIFYWICRIIILMGFLALILKKVFS